ncbi:hypothetical protein FNV43_RR15869 [Rhamnella rubrinervis]|uniref:Auxin-responsive protein n=1 Tax=Rhamnella rubrinervis TaxID=2594499 RepID=A0A8K0E7D6_9ROSA|nr:hypothetical protein FNV43_RR15869 [Rhamnella rubrinervis]
MPPDSESEVSSIIISSMALSDTELTLALPGHGHNINGGFRAPPSAGSSRQLIRIIMWTISWKTKCPAQVIGWPPVRSSRKKVLMDKYVKVAVDGAAYLRKVNLEMYSCYKDLLKALNNMFNITCFTTIQGDYDFYVDQSSKLMKAVKGIEYVPTYEDKDGDLMLVGDVPWKMFIESCKRIRLMKSSEAVGLAPETSTSPECTSSIN